MMGALDALEAVAAGLRVRRDSWAAGVCLHLFALQRDESRIALLSQVTLGRPDGGYLAILGDGEMRPYCISEGDLRAMDWKVME